MAFGLTGSHGTFQGAMNKALVPLQNKLSLLFFDDILMYNKRLEEHLMHGNKVLGILHREQWSVKFSKCTFAQNQVAYLGHAITA